MRKKILVSLVVLFNVVLIICVVFLYNRLSHTQYELELLEDQINETLNEKKFIAHRGYSEIAPENTLPAFELARLMGFKYIECDVQFTKDGIPVLIHDKSIDFVSDGKGKVRDIKYNDLLKYDFGNWKNESYKGTKILSFDEFMSFCSKNDMRPYVEIKDTKRFPKEKESFKDLIRITKKYDMLRQTTWLSSNIEYLKEIVKIDKYARCGYWQNDMTSIISTVECIKTGYNIVFININYSLLTEELIEECKANNLLIEVWTVDDVNIIEKLDPYVNGFTTNTLYNSYIEKCTP